jgi:drug/metabolite transporter (DMT)-like permease
MLVACAAIIWSTGGLIVRSLELADMWTTVFWRSLFAAGFLAGFIAFRERERSLALFRAMGIPGVIVGGCFAAASVSLVVALNLTSVANTLIVLSTSPMIAAILGRALLGETVRVRAWITMGVALLGVVIMVSDSFARGSIYGDLIAFLIALSLAVATVTIRMHPEIRMTPAVCIGTTAAAIVALPLATPMMVTGGDFSLLLAFGAIQLGGGLALFVSGARLAPAAEVALISLLEPILGPIWVWAMVGEYPGLATLIGGGLVLAALAVYLAVDLRRTRLVPPAA